MNSTFTRFFNSSTGLYLNSGDTTRGATEAMGININDESNTLPSIESVYMDPFLWEIKEELSGYSLDPRPDSILKYRYRSSSFLRLNSLTVVGNSFAGIEADRIDVAGTIELLPSSTGGFAGRESISSNVGGTSVEGVSGTNLLSGLWGDLPRGGDGGNGTGNAIGGAGGYGFSGSGASETIIDFSSGYHLFTGGGGGLIFLISSEITGFGILRAKGGDSYGDSANDGHLAGGGGGGMILILTKKWSGTVGLDVSGGSGDSSGGDGQSGSYAIFKINDNGSLTLMVYNENNGDGTATLNGQEPLYGTNASIGW